MVPTSGDESDVLLTESVDGEEEYGEDFPEAEIIETADLIEDEEGWFEEEWFPDEEMLSEDTDELAEEELAESEGIESEDFFEELEEMTEEAEILGASTSGTTGNCKWRVQDTDTLFIEGSGVEYVTQMEWINPAYIEGYNNITKIIIGGGLTSVGDNMFHDYKNIKTVRMYSTVPRIGKGAFKGCTSLEKVETYAQEIGQEAFSGCTKLNEVTSGNIKTIGDSAFSDCSALSSIKWGKIETIGDMAFLNCTGLTLISEAVKLENIGMRAFMGCKNLIKATGLVELTDIGPQAFRDCENLQALLEWDKVTHIHTGAFTNCKSLKMVTLPLSLETLGTLAFAQCAGLEKIFALGDKLTTIEDGAFYNCINLTEVPLKESITSLGIVQMTMDGGYEHSVSIWSHTEKDGVFHGCKALQKVTIPSKVTLLAEKLFFDSGVKEVVLPDGITEIGSRVFEGCIKLEKMNWPAGIPVVPQNAFKYCIALTEVKLNEGVTTIDTQAFDNCSSLKTLIFPSTLSKIGKDAFGGCVKLEAADLGKTKLTELPERVFNGCTALSTVTLPTTIQLLNVRAFSGSAIKSLIGPESLKKVGELAFDGCAELETLDLQYVQEFAANAVRNCPKLTKLDISNKITAVTDHSFVTNKVEKTVTFHGKKSEFEKIPNLSKNMDLLSGKIVYTVPEETEVDLLEKVILAKTDQGDLPEASFAPLCVYASKTTKASITIKWNKMDGAESYLVYGAARKKETYKKLAQVSSTTTKYSYKKLKKDTFYKFIVVAVTGNGSDAKIGAVSRTVIVATRGGKYRNAVSVKSNTKKKIKLAAGKKQTLKPRIISKVSVGRKMKTYRKTAYESSDPTVAKVTSKGKIKAVGKGTCTIYIYAQNGVYIAVKVKVS